MSCRSNLQLINQRAESLRCADPVLVEELQPLNAWTIGHETVKFVGVGGAELRQSRVSSRRRDVLEDAPHARVGGVLVLGLLGIATEYRKRPLHRPEGRPRSQSCAKPS